MTDEASAPDERDAGRKVTLYGPAAIPFTEKVRRGLLYKRVTFDLVEPTDAADYRRWSPESGLLPVLEIDGVMHPDSTNILFKLDELFPEPPFLSSDPRVSGQQTQLEDWADENLLFYFNKWTQTRDSQPDPVTAPSRWARMWRRIGAWLRAGGTWERPETAVLRGIDGRLDDLIGFLGTRPFFYSNHMSMADLGVYGFLFTLTRDAIPGSKGLLISRTALLEFMRRVEHATEPDGEPA